MSNDISHKELFWDRITRERMSEVGSDRPFDILVRGEYNAETEDVEGFDLGKRPGVKVDMANFDLENCYLRIYDVDFSPASTDFDPGAEFSEGRKVSGIIQELDNDWGYELATIPYDNTRELERPENSLLAGTVYWPEHQDFARDEAYEDFVDMVGSDVLSEL
ncbi:hypothetical protein GKQ38_04140 [Candidatus Nanohaloarchaea archaeon]|nr:hypothetical protein GKQ38_04140 [Candidatus Nanohaloarchaea archaeon]